jgi:multicomponent Na+:H+ antiporter subunit D
VASSLLAMMYVWRVVETLYMKQPAAGAQYKEAPLSMLIPLWGLSLATIYFGFATDITVTAANTAADGLLSGFSGLQ